MRRKLLWSLALVVAVSGLARSLAGQPPGGTPVFTAAQAESGKTSYLETCSPCHAGDLGGSSDAPKLAGVDFLTSWRERTTKELLQYVQGMPPDGPSLSAEEYLAVASYLLQQNGAVAGSQPLTPATAVPLGSIATGERPPRQ